MIYRSIAILFPLALWPACSPTPTEPQRVPLKPHTLDIVVEPELTLEEQQRKLEEERANQPEPTLNPEDPREKGELVWGEGRSALRGIYTERDNLLTQMRDVRFDKALGDAEGRYRGLVRQIEDFAIGEKADEVDTAAARFCALVDGLVAGSDALRGEGDAKLAEIDAALKALEAKQAEGGKVATRQYEKLEAERKVWSAPSLAAGYVVLAMRTIYDEALVLVDKGPRRAQVAIRDCLTKPDAKPSPNELVEKARQEVIKRSRYYLP